MTWETVIGLEVHVQLATDTKLFSGADTAFGAQPNTQACAIDLAMPGTLPAPNEQAFRYAIMFGLAIDAQIGKRSVFERKNYFYPDLPKGYQTTQLAEPIVGPGVVAIRLDDGSSKQIRIHHAHLEEDAGKSLHEDFDGLSGIDLNRAGTPLIEIVSEPDLRSAKEAVSFAKKLHSIVTSLGICDGNMSQGSLRFDVNISVRRPGQPLGTRTETKNLNSFRFMEEAIAMEVDRQIAVLEDGGNIQQETRLYDGADKSARAMRSKEEANDYRYFPCPDLLPVVIDDALIATLRESLPELPDARRQRFIEQYKLSDYDASQLCEDAAVAHFFEAAVALNNDPKMTANWIMGEISARLNAEEDKSMTEILLSPAQLSSLIERIKDGALSSKMAKEVFDCLWRGDQADVDTIIDRMGGGQVSDRETLNAIIDDVIANSARQVDHYRKAPMDKRPKMLGYFVGQVMKASRGKANPQLVNQLLQQRLHDEQSDS